MIYIIDYLIIQIEYYFFPMDDFMTSEASIISPELMIERLNTLNKIVNNDNYIVVTNLMGLLRYLPNKSLYKRKIINLNVNEDVNREVLINNLIDLGYDRVPLVTKTGEVAIRGYVIDIFPMETDSPIRIEFWGDTIDSIKYFDLDSQISSDSINTISIYPFTEFLLDNKLDVDSKMRKQKYLPHYSRDIQGIWNYLDNYTLIYYDYNQIISAYRLLRESIINYDNEINDSIKTDYMFDISDVKYNNIIYMLEFDNILDLNIKFKNNYLSNNIDNYHGDFEKIKTSLFKYISGGKTVIMCIDNKDVAKRVITYLDIMDDVVLTRENEIIKNKINIINKYIISDLYIIIMLLFLRMIYLVK